ncbi:uncharacterized protein N0V89_011527 [Didymosphaeria variabile]|uniref:Uncharacterized protein n=1 Tax=Didymosphaeria variabile TaxID=1932322 RepID=A0A9W8X9X7_9PLEO|nr:uncharacterized protein N0V89_011527 [Didymosphaeria variabile]KAJ4345397.1 hypothetical protein N0V89_011527 [Didymosphaeria variabile]
MPTGEQTPRHVYPTSKDVTRATNAAQHLLDVEQRVTAVLNAIDYNTGNIHRMIAEDLASSAAEEELALLPKTDYCSVQYASGITETCKAMLRDKIERYQRQHAHNLISEEMVDVLVKWQCSANGPQPYRLLPEDEFAYVQIAHDCRYKYLDWNLEHAEEKTYDDGTKPPPGACRKPPRADTSIPPAPATHQGGFYTCVIQELLPFLESLSELWTASIQVVVHPKLMTEEEQKEMDAYHAARRQAEDAIKLAKALAKIEKEALDAKDEELGLKRRRHTYPRQDLLERDIRNLLYLDPAGFTSADT